MENRVACKRKVCNTFPQVDDPDEDLTPQVNNLMVGLEPNRRPSFIKKRMNEKKLWRTMAGLNDKTQQKQRLLRFGLLNTSGGLGCSRGLALQPIFLLQFFFLPQPNLYSYVSWEIRIMLIMIFNSDICWGGGGVSSPQVSATNQFNFPISAQGPA